MTPATRPSRFEFFLGVASLVGLVSVAVAASHVGGGFIAQAFASPGATTVALDLMVLGLAVVVWVVVEARRLGMRWPWLWAAVAVPLPGAFVVPVFLLFRERRLRSFEAASAALESRE